MSEDRKLATIRKIAGIDPIPGADAIEKLTVDGWELVSQKGNFKPLDYCVYFEIDSFLPVRPEFEFLRDRCYKNSPHMGEGFKLKTIKLRGQISQGLALPVSELFPGAEVVDALPDNVVADAKTLVLGQDVTEVLNVKKWEPPPKGVGSSFGPSSTKGNWPEFLRKTDQERIQNCFGGVKNWIYYTKQVDFITELPDDPMFKAEGVKNADIISGDMITYYRNEGGGWIVQRRVPNAPDIIDEREMFEATIKLDGSSMTIYNYNGQFGVCSRNMELKRVEGNAFWDTAIKTGVIGTLTQMGLNLALQGELMGPGIQGNRENLEELTFYLFDVYDIEERRYWSPKERAESPIMTMLFNNPFATHRMAHVPVVDMCARPFSKEATVKDILAVSDNVKSINHPIAEGIVYKSLLLGGPSFKAISNKFLLKEKDE